MVNNEVKDFFIVLAIRLLDAVESFIQLHEGSGAAISIRLFALREGHMESLMQRAAENGSRNGEDGDLKVVLDCQV
jgi:hypothetical protein